MRITTRLEYGTSGLQVELPADRTTVIEPVFIPLAPDPSSALRKALQSPIGKSPLRELGAAGKKIGISVCDITRAQPRELMIDALLSEMPNVQMHDVTIFIATGTHRTNTEEELERMLGQKIARGCHVICHNARDNASMEYVGKTVSGVPVFLNREWVAAGFRITTGFVEPHFFAGFSGGPKMVAPGLASLETVMHLHDARRIGDPKATWGVTEGNPIHDDVREIARMTGVDFAFDISLNREQQVTAAFAGEILQEHAAACAAVRETAMRPVNTLFDVEVTTNSGYPLDQNLYQTIKGISAAAKIIKPGGTIICAAECRDGIPNHGAYGAILSSCASSAELLRMITTPGYSRPDQWQVQIQAQIQLKARVLLKSDGLSDDQIRAAHLEPIHDVAAAADEALRRAGPGACLCVLPQGPQTIPYLSPSSG
jgi:nickel-dependent lactate racemase